MNSLNREQMISSLQRRVDIEELKYYEMIRYQKEVSKLREDIQTLNRALTKIQIVKDKCKRRIINYREERLHLLEEKIKKSLDIIYPGDDFNVEFVPKIYNNKEILRLKAGRGEQLSSTRLQNGNLFRQVINLVGTTCVQEILGCNLIILDEAVNGGDTESTSLCSLLIKALIDMGYQIVVIEHKGEFFETLPRLQHNLTRNVETNKIERIDVIEYKGDLLIS